MALLADHWHAVAQELLDEACVVFALAEGRILHDRLLKRDRRLDAGDHVFAQSSRHAADAGGAAGGGGDDFGDH